MASTGTRSRRLPSSAQRWLACAKPADGGFALQLAFLAIAAAAIWLLFEHAGLDRWLTALAYASPGARCAAGRFTWRSPQPQYGGASLAGAGHCSPAAHPLAGFALFGLYFALRSERPAAACAALAAAWIIGLGAGAIQVARGAHFASHVLWTAWVAWAVTLAAARLATPRA